jgi:hypothetical protein
MEEQLAAIQFLTKEIGPRPATSAAEARAAAYINSRLRQAGMEVDVQTFQTVPTESIPRSILYLAMVAAPFVGLYSRLAALIIASVALVVFVAEQLAWPVLSSWLPGGKSQNVVGTRPAAQEGRQHLVVMAHIDSGRANLLYHPRLLGRQRGLYVLLFILMVLLPILIGLGWATGEPWLWYAQLAPAGGLVLAFLLLLHQEIIMPWSPGANDNASGVAVLLRLAEELQGLQHPALWLVGTGSKEAGLHGARNFMRHYPFLRENTYIINVDTVGRGELGIIVWEGPLFARRADPTLVELAGRSESGDITIDADPRVYHLTLTDAQVALARGFRAMSILALENGQPAFRHWPNDTAENIVPDLLERATRLVVGIARRLDRGSADEEP